MNEFSSKREKNTREKGYETEKKKKRLSVQIKNVHIPLAISEVSNLACALFSEKGEKKQKTFTAAQQFPLVYVLSVTVMG